MLRPSQSFGLFCLLAKTLAYGQTGANVEGRVVNSVTGEPVSGAAVQLSPLKAPPGSGQPSLTQSQPDGEFHFDGIAAGLYVLRARHEGFTAPPGDFAAHTFNVEEGQLVSNLSISLVPDSTVTGKVLDDEGKPVPGVRVVALAKDSVRGLSRLVERSTATSEESGAFSIAKLRPGNYFFVAQPESRDEKPSPNGDLVWTVYPHSPDMDGATPLVVSPGQPPSELNFYLLRGLTYRVRGRVSDKAADLRLKVELVPQSATEAATLIRSVRAGRDGSFEFDQVPSGSYLVRLVGRRAHLLAAQEVSVAASDKDNLVLTPADPVTITGNVRVDGQNVGTSFGSIRMLARALSGPGGADDAIANVTADGSFVLKDLEPESYLFRIRFGNAGYYVQSLSLNGQDVNNKAADLSSGAAAKLEVTLRTDVAEIDGKVQESSADTSIILVPQVLAPDASNVTVTSLRSDGSFVIPNLAPGQYLIYAVDSADLNLWHTHEFLQQVRNQGLEVTVAEGQKQQVQLQLVSRPVIEQVAQQLGLPFDS